MSAPPSLCRCDAPRRVPLAELDKPEMHQEDCPYRTEANATLSFGGAPRPWRASPNNSNACATVHDAEGICIGEAKSRHAGMDAPAIAVLFAAAPDVAQALHAAMRFLTFACGVPEDHEVVEQARAALVKAGRLS